MDAARRLGPTVGGAPQPRLSRFGHFAPSPQGAGQQRVMRVTAGRRGACPQWTSLGVLPSATRPGEALSRAWCSRATASPSVHDLCMRLDTSCW